MNDLNISIALLAFVASPSGAPFSRSRGFPWHLQPGQVRVPGFQG